MAISQILSRGAPWAQGRTYRYPSASEANNIRTYGRTGVSAPGTLGTSPLLQIGTLIPGTPYVYVKPRLSQNDLGAFGGSPFVPYRYPGASQGIMAGIRATPAVVRTNPEFAFFREKRRTPSIGMNAALQMGATMQVPYENDGEPHFSVA